MPTIFIAVQCCQCSTMQVKQQKKSSNRWNCVICNQKQSVRKVFAQGFMAKDVRKFVQGFNMSRQFAEENEIEDRFPPPEKVDDLDMSSNGKKRRNDWTQFLDPEDEDDNKDEETRVDLREPDVVTEMPKEMFKKPKLKNYSIGLATTEGNKAMKPVFSKRRNTNKTIRSEDKEERESPPRMFKEASKWSDYLTQDDDHDDDELLLERKREFPDSLCSWSQGVLKNQLRDERVENDIHPDF